MSNCDAQSICDYLASPNGTIIIHDNAPGCNSPEEVEEDCENNCLPEGITFTTQEQIDNFQTNYPGCTEIEGNVTINGDNITNLNGLSVLTSIGGDFLIGGCAYLQCNPLLTSLTGLDNLTSIGSYLGIKNNYALTSICGLQGFHLHRG